MVKRLFFFTVTFLVMGLLSGAEHVSATTISHATIPPQRESFNNAPAQQGTVGTLCVASFIDLNRNGVRDAGEVLLAGSAITVTNSLGQVVGSATTNAIEPRCFANLPAGLYSVVESNPSVQSTSADRISVEVVAGSSALASFGNVQFTPMCAPPIMCTTSDVNTPRGIVVVDSTTGRIYVANFDTSSVTVIDSATCTIVNVYSSGGTHPKYLALNPVTNRLYVATSR